MFILLGLLFAAATAALIGCAVVLKTSEDSEHWFYTPLISRKHPLNLCAAYITVIGFFASFGFALTQPFAQPLPVQKTYAAQITAAQTAYENAQRIELQAKDTVAKRLSYLKHHDLAQYDSSAVFLNQLAFDELRPLDDWFAAVQISDEHRCAYNTWATFANRHIGTHLPETLPLVDAPNFLKFPTILQTGLIAAPTMFILTGVLAASVLSAALPREDTRHRLLKAGTLPVLALIIGAAIGYWCVTHGLPRQAGINTFWLRFLA